MMYSRSINSTLMLCLFLGLTNVESGSEAEIIKALEETEKEVAWKHIPLSGPAFDRAYSKNVTTQIGKTAILNCRIRYLGGKTVSWMRVRDLHLLTVGRFTYTSDERFRTVHTTGSDDWLLKIHYAQRRDAGAYECQVSTTPPISTSIWLNVVAEPQTEILGGPDLFINSGSTINLTCVVNHSSDPPPYILWYHQNQLLSYDSPRGGITVVTEHGVTSSSRLLIQRVTVKDAGEYTCRPANAEPHQITVHIVSNEHPAAIHHMNGTSGSFSIHQRLSSYYTVFLSLMLSILTIYPTFLLAIFDRFSLCLDQEKVKSKDAGEYKITVIENQENNVSLNHTKDMDKCACTSCNQKLIVGFQNDDNKEEKSPTIICNLSITNIIRKRGRHIVMAEGKLYSIFMSDYMNLDHIKGILLSQQVNGVISRQDYKCICS